MEFRFRKDTLPLARKKVLARISFFLAVSGVCFLLFLFSSPWYLSLLPGAIFIAAAVVDFRGMENIEKHRNGLKIVVTNQGIAVQSNCVKNTVFWPWEDVSIKREKLRKGVISSFTISTGKKHVKNWEFTNDIESFSKLYELVCENTHA